MASPFPGMDPYLENPAYWPDFHSRFVNYWCEAVADVLPANYEANLAERVYLEGPRETYIVILHRPDRSLVAVLELLSPANKEYPGRTEYLAKRMALINQDVHLVELDLLRGGHRLPMQKPLPPAAYYYFVSRGEQRPDCQVYCWNIRQPLPKFPVPLRSPDVDVYTDLAVVFATAYERGRFGRRVDYREPVPGVLPEDDRRWAAALIGEMSKLPKA